MLELLPVLEKSKKRNRIYTIISVLGMLSIFIIIVFLASYYQALILIFYPSSLAPIAQELTVIDFFWMIGVLILFFFANTSIWYYMSNKISKISINLLNSAEKSDSNDIFCYNCGIKKSRENLQNKTTHEVKLLRIFNIEGYYCKECYQKYSWDTLGTILIASVIYFFLVFLILPLIAVFGISFVPESYWYLYATIVPVLIFMQFTMGLYLIYNRTKVSKIYERKFKIK